MSDARVQNLSEVLRGQARERGAATAIVDGTNEVSYAELDERASRVSQALLSSGAKYGDRAAILGSNCLEFYEVLAGCAKARIALAPVNFRLSVDEIHFIIADIQPRILFVDESMAAKVRDALNAAKLNPVVVELARDSAVDSEFATWRDGSPEDDPFITASPDDNLLLLYTSGTTGLPKGVRITNRNYSYILNTVSHVPGFAYGAGDTIADPIPLFHIAGINVGMAGLAQGCKIIVIRKFVPLEFLRDIERLRINHAFLVPSMLISLLQADANFGGDFSSLRTIAYGGAPITDDTLEKARRHFGCSFAQLYGMTETSGAGTVLTPAEHACPDKLRSCGLPWPGIDVRIVDSSGRDAAPCEVGELLMKGDCVSPGYWRHDVATAHGATNGWLRSGDAAYRDEYGYIYIHDRLKDMIVSGAENIYPAEVENAIASCPGVIEVAVIGVPSIQWGEEVKAVVACRSTSCLSERDVIDWTKSKIASYKAPKSVDFVDALPRNAAGKLLKRELRDRYWRGKNRGIG